MPQSSRLNHPSPSDLYLIYPISSFDDNVSPYHTQMNLEFLHTHSFHITDSMMANANNRAWHMSASNSLRKHRAAFQLNLRVRWEVLPSSLPTCSSVSYGEGPKCIQSPTLEPQLPPVVTAVSLHVSAPGGLFAYSVVGEYHWYDNYALYVLWSWPGKYPGEH